MSLPEFNSLYHRLEVSVHLINAYRKRVLQREVFAVFGKDRVEIPVERHVVAHHHSVSDSHRKAHRLVVRVADSNCESTAGECGFQFHDSEKFHAVAGYGVFFPDWRDVPEAKSFNKSAYNFVVRNYLMGCG